jgi:phosphatidylserine/phosphatidylglycerophosphate/cardiolipin synthase-like enzyme
MRNIARGDVLAVRAIGGLHVVTLAWDFAEGQEAKRDGLLGFAIERTEIRDGQETERYFLRGIKRFEFKDEGLEPGTPVPTSEHPVQSFQWADYTAKPKERYRFRVVPCYGKPKLLKLDDDAATSVEIETEPEAGEEDHNGAAAHDIYFNRGAAGSQAYARKFPDARPDETKPDSEQMKWLSRGLYEALVKFIGRASGPRFALRAMLYEFQYLPVGKAFKAAKKAGADVAIRYEAKSYLKKNEKMIAAAAIKRICKRQKTRGGIRHNKFVVLLEDDKPIAVWTGSTNISAGGIFGHSNVGHIVWDDDVAARFLEYWDQLADANVSRAPLVKANLQCEPTPDTTNVSDERVLTLFSPRDDKKKLPTLEWYADLMRSAKEMLCITFAFNLDDRFLKILKSSGDTLRYAVFDDNPSVKVTEQIQTAKNTVIAAGAKLEEGDMGNFIGEELTGFNSNNYIHDKFLLVDPLSANPVVVTGSANFSAASQWNNDENMLVISGNTRVADIYFGEFMRVFDHLYSRYIVALMKRKGTHDPKAGYLDKGDGWVKSHFKPGRKDLRRRYFMSE